MNTIMLLFNIKEQIEIWNKQLNKLAEQFDNPFAGMAIFMILLVISFIAIRSYSSK